MGLRSWRAPGAAQPSFGLRRVAGSAALALALLAPRSALAAEGSREQPVSASLELLTLNPCLERPLFVQEVEGWLERSAVDARLRVQVGEKSGTLWFSIAVADGPRMTHAFPDLPEDCSEIRRAIALSIALAIDAVSPEAAPSPTRGGQWALAAHAAIATGLPSGLAYGGGASVRRGVGGAFSAGLGALALVAPGRSLRAELPVRFDTRLVAARVEGCVVLPLLRGRAPAAPHLVAAGGCAGAWAGQLATLSTDLPDAASDARFWMALAAALELHMRVTGAFGVSAGVDASLPLQRHKVRVDTNEGQSAAEQEFQTVALIFRAGPSFFF